MMTKWDYLDTLYLANNFNTSELQNEIDQTKRKFPYEDWHSDFIECCREAIRWIRASQSKPIVTNGRHVNVESLKANLDIVQIAERYTRLSKSGNDFKGICPLHSEKKPSFVVHPDRQSWHCFGCNTGGDSIALVMKAENVDFKGAAAILGGAK
jgi:hypothetical protein